MNARPRYGLMLLTLLAMLPFSSFIATRPAQANSSVSVNISVFHDALAPYGNWVNHRTYGQVWYPRNVAQDWRPYTDGYWAHTNDYGWLWVSYEPWGWAPFHYGRWAWDNWYGWVWVPGRTWAPAWVFWRSGGGYAAWAPMPPNVVWQPNIGLNISYFNYDRDLRWDSWVAVREYDLPYRHMSRRICPPRQNLQIFNVTNNINNVTLINNTIVNQGVPVKQIEALTGKPIVSVVPSVQDKVSVNTAVQQEDQPNIIRLPIAPPTHDEIHHNEELARWLDGKNPDGTRTELPVVNPGQSGDQEPRVAGRLIGAPAPVQSPYTTPEQPNPTLTEPVDQILPLPAAPETPLVEPGLDSDKQHKESEGGSHQEALVPLAQPSDQQSSAVVQPIIPVPPQADGASAPVPGIDQQPVSTDTAALPPLQNQPQPIDSANSPDKQPHQDSVTDQALIPSQTDGASNPVPVIDQQSVSTDSIAMSPLQNQLQPLDSAKQPDDQPLHADQHTIERQQAENLQRQQQIDQLQQELARTQDKEKRQEMQPQLTDRVTEENQQMQQQEAARQQEVQNQQQLELQQQQAERARGSPANAATGSSASAGSAKSTATGATAATG